MRKILSFYKATVKLMSITLFIAILPQKTEKVNAQKDFF